MHERLSPPSGEGGPASALIRREAEVPGLLASGVSTRVAGDGLHVAI